MGVMGDLGFGICSVFFSIDAGRTAICQDRV
jgi:hypothetical protein